MNIKEKIYSLEKAMVIKKREDETSFTCFSDNADEKLKDLFLEHYEIKDVDYQVFSQACDTIYEVWTGGEVDLDTLYDYIDESYNDFASPYNSDRLAYLNVWNESEIAEISKNYSCESISLACAIWYDEQVKNAINIIVNNYLK